MSLRSLPQRLRDEPAMMDIIGAGTATVAVSDAAAAYLIAGLCHLGTRNPVLVVTPTIADATRIAHDLSAFMGTKQVGLLPAWDTLPFERVSPDATTMGQRLRLLWRMGIDPVNREPGGTAPIGVPDDQLRVAVAPVRALLQRLGPVEDVARPVRVVAGERIDLEKLVVQLVGMGYRREYQVEHRGEVAVRGGIVDVFPASADLPVRIDLWGDEVDRLAEFDPGTQRSLESVDHVEIFGCREVLPTDEIRARAKELVGQEPWGARHWERLAQGQCFDGMESWLPWLVRDDRVLPDQLTSDAQVVLLDPRRIRDRATELIADEEALASALALTWGVAGSSEQTEGRDGNALPGVAGSVEPGGVSFPRLHVPFERLLQKCQASVLTVLPVSEGPSVATMSAHAWEPVLGDVSRLARRLSTLADEGFAVALCAEGDGAAARLTSSLADEGLVVSASTSDEELSRPGVRTTIASLDRGFVVPGAKVAVLAESDVTGRRRSHRPPKSRARTADTFFDDLSPGMFVVHRQHGVARYAGMVTRTMGGATRDYLLLEYRGDDKLYLPSDQVDVLTPYTGGESPAVNRLGGSDWQRTRSKAQAAVHEVAEELVELYRRRLAVPGHAFAPDTPWQRELEDAFAYVETPDQQRAIDDVKADMELQRPMDRLICADVGFGKTEVAVRATFKAIQDGKQVAILVPTTLLAQQHAQTFADRYAGFPVRVEMLSRFLTAAQAKVVVAGMADGSVDVVIGTHRLLGGDVRFKNLGLLVVDEEQRFGVSHKEGIKAMAEGVDVLTLSANPIPRTLEMALTGIRDLSLVTTPPAERQPILTFVGENDEAAVVEAIRRELLREGQAFFVHNTVSDIDVTAARLGRLVPEARIAVAHGQMDEGMLEQVVLDFWEKRFDVLVCTTIVESGIDIPSVNTLIVDRADRLGLGQLHQLRGRVGRGGQRAYAYLFHPADKVLGETAYERLRTIGEHTELGSGFKIAMRDLEIRGSGNLLGRDQSGHIAAIGYDLYVQMVADAVAELKGEQKVAPVELSLDLPADAHLPSSYVEREDLRIEAYRRLTQVADDQQVDDLRVEWEDRFGPLPSPALQLLDVARLRVECMRTGIQEVSVAPARPGQVAGLMPGKRGLVAKMSPLELPASARVRLRRISREAVYREDARTLTVLLPPDPPPSVTLRELLLELLPAS